MARGGARKTPRGAVGGRDPMAALIRVLRVRRGLSLQALGKLVSASAPHLYHVEVGRKLPSEALAMRIGKVLGQDQDVFRAWVRTAGRSGTIAAMTSARRLETFLAMARVEETRGATRVLVPVIEPGDDPDAAPRRREWLRLDPRDLAAVERLVRPFAYPLSAAGARRGAGTLPEGGFAILSRDAGWPPEPGRIYALLRDGRVELGALLWNGSELLLLPAPGDSDFVTLRHGDAASAETLLRGRVILVSGPREGP